MKNVLLLLLVLFSINAIGQDYNISKDSDTLTYINGKKEKVSIKYDGRILLEDIDFKMINDILALEIYRCKSKCKYPRTWGIESIIFYKRGKSFSIWSTMYAKNGYGVEQTYNNSSMYEVEDNKLVFRYSATH